MAVIERHKKVYEGITTMLRRGEFTPGEKLPSERELIERFKVSRPTVNKAITRLVAEGVLYKKSGRKGAFFNGEQSDNADENQENSVQHKVIKYISPRNTGKNPVQYGVMEGIYSIASRHDFQTVPEYVAGNQEWKDRVLGNDTRHLEGIVIYGKSFDLDLPEIEVLNASGVPYVIVDSMPEHGEFNFVGTDNVKGAHIMVDYLCSLGHEKICYVTENDIKGSMKQRLAGYLQGMIANDLEIASASVLKINESDETGFLDSIERLIQGPDRPTAIFASHDKFLVKIYEFLCRMGIRCPEEISLAGYDDIDISAYMPVPLTTVKQDFYKMGKLAAELILNENEAILLPQKILLEPDLVIRKSTGEVKSGQ